MKKQKIWAGVLFSFFFLNFFGYVMFCQGALAEPVAPTAVSSPPAAASLPAIVPANTAATIDIDFKDADIRNVLGIISYSSGMNIVASPEVTGTVTMRLNKVPWEDALKTIVGLYGYGYDKRDNIVIVAPIEKLTEQKKMEVELSQVQPTITEVFNLKFIDALDAKKAIEPQLSARGKVTILEMTGQGGWAFGGSELGKRTREAVERPGRSKVLIISDTPPAIDKVRRVVEQIDVKPQQVLIETRIMEVNRDRLKDIGFDYGTGTAGAESSTISSIPAGKTRAGNDISTVGGNILGSQVSPASFGAKAGAALLGVEPYNTGLNLLFKKLHGRQFEVMLHALEEDVSTNTLSAPRVLALNNQEATILIGTRYPILKTEVSGTDSTTTTVTLDYYQDIGIQLNVVPQIGVNNYINMIIHPAISTRSGTLGDNQYPIIEMRETETRVLMKDEETIVIGGLLKDVKGKTITGVPFLSKIPFLGALFRRETLDTEKIDLLIFITARIIKEGEITPEELAKLEARMERPQIEPVIKKEKARKEKIRKARVS